MAEKGGERTVKYVGDKVSYIRHPFAKNSYYSLALAVLGLLLAAASMALSVRNAGQGGLVTGALGFSSIAAVVMGGWYGLLSFTEKEKNYILTKIGLGIILVVVVFWLMVIIVGLR